MKLYLCKVYWETSGEIEVIARNPEHAAKLAIVRSRMNNTGMKQYVPDSMNCDPETDVQEIDKTKGNPNEEQEKGPEHTAE